MNRTARSMFYRGFTLAEMACSMAVIGIIVVSLGSVLVLVGRGSAISSGGTGANATASRAVCDEVIADLKVATAFTERTSTAVTFTVPDRTGDGAPETIRYAWGGTPGNPLTRQFNGGTVVPIALNVQLMNFNYLLRTVGVNATTAQVESSEQLLASHVGPAPSCTGASPTDKNWGSQYVYPSSSLAGSLAWKITRIQLQVQSGGGSSGPFTVQVQTAGSSNQPTGTVVDSAVVDPSTLPVGTTSWVEFAFSNCSGLDPTQGYCIVISSVAGNTNLLFYDSSSTDSSLVLSMSSDAGKAWTSQPSTQALQFYMYGTVSTPAPPLPPPPEASPTFQ